MTDAVARQPANIDVLETIAGIELVAATPASQPVYLHRLLSLDPDNSKGHYALAARLLTEGKRGVARQELLSAVSRNGEPRAVLLAALATSPPTGPVTGQPSRLALRALEADVANQDYWSALAGLLRRMDRPGAASYADHEAQRWSEPASAGDWYRKLVQAAVPPPEIDVAEVRTAPPAVATALPADDGDLRALLGESAQPEPPEPAPMEPAAPEKAIPTAGSTPASGEKLDDENAPVPLIW